MFCSVALLPCRKKVLSSNPGLCLSVWSLVVCLCSPVMGQWPLTSSNGCWRQAPVPPVTLWGQAGRDWMDKRWKADFNVFRSPRAFSLILPATLKIKSNHLIFSQTAFVLKVRAVSQSAADLVWEIYRSFRSGISSCSY